MIDYFKWSWWNEKTIEISEHYFDWKAPRWYMAVVVLSYMFVLCGVICAFLNVANTEGEGSRKQRDADMAWHKEQQQAHDSAIASKAVKEFAEKVCKYFWEQAGGLNLSVKGTVKKLSKDIRAMAEGKE